MTDDTQDQAANHLPAPRAKDSAAVSLGRRGGRAGRGPAKRRTRAQAQAAIRVRWAKRAETAGTTPSPPPP